MPSSATIDLKLQLTEAGSSAFGGPNFSVNLPALLNLSDGTGSGQVTYVYAKQRTVLSGANDDLDLNGVALQTELGVNIAATSIVAILVLNAPKTGPANTTALTIGGGTNPVTTLMGGTTPTIKLPVNGGYLHFCGESGGLGAVVAGTGDILRIANAAGASNTYQIVLLLRA